MHPSMRDGGHKHVVEVSRLSFEDAHLSGGEDVIHIMANRIDNDWPGDVVKRGASGHRSGPRDRIAYPGPRRTIIVGTLHTDQGRVLRIVVGNVYVCSVRCDPRAIVTGEVNDLRGAAGDAKIG